METPEEVKAHELDLLLYRKEAAAPMDEIRRLVAGNPLTITHVSNTGARTVLIEASVRDHVEAVAFLLESGAEVDAVDCNDWTSLHWAGDHRNIAIATLLLDSGASVTACCKQCHYTPLHYAAQAGGPPDVVRLLVARGADVNAVGNQGNTPLHVAVMWGNASIVTAQCEGGGGVHPHKHGL